MPAPNLAPWLDLAQGDTDTFEARMRTIPPSLAARDRVLVVGELYEVEGYQSDGMPGYWLQRIGPGFGVARLFLPIDMADQVAQAMG